MKQMLCVLVSLLVLGGGMRAQTPPPSETAAPPVLSDLTKATIVVKAQAVKLLEQQIEILARDLEKAREVLAKAVADATPVGFVLNEKLDPIARPPPAEAAQP